MDDIETLKQADLGPGDLGAALALSTAVGWNQTEADWRLFLEHGRAFGLFARERLVATAAILPYGADFGWISMVIVAPPWRRLGLADRLMRAAIAALKRARRAALLDATPAGAEVYEKLGFLTLGGMERWEGEGASAATLPLPRVAGIDRLVAADAEAFGADRRFLLGDVLARGGSAAFALDDGDLVIRRGLRATQLGPLVAGSPATAAALISRGLDAVHGPIFLDLLEGWSALAPLLEARGFRRQRPFLRMARGRARLPGNPARLALAAGPEFG